MTTATSVSRAIQPRLFTRIALCMGFGVLTSVIAQQVMSQGVDSAPQVTIKYDDLNLAKPHDAAVLYGRIQNAAKVTCERYSGSDLHQAMLFDACVSHAVTNAVSAVNSPALLAAYTARTGKVLPAKVALSQAH